MVKEVKHRKDSKKKPSLTIKERRAKKLEKRQHKLEHRIDENIS